MSELRQDPISSRWVIIAEQRSARPMQFNTAEPTERAGDCPFCMGNEAATPPETFAVRKAASQPDSSGWSVRVVPNKYPALDNSTPQEENNAERELYRRLPGMGGHEVVIEAAEHITRGAALDVERWRDVLWTYGERLRFWKSEASFPFAVVFKNVGRDGGASLEHLHSQLLVLPLTPPEIEQELTNTQAYFDRHGSDPIGRIIQDELTAGNRVVCNTPEYLAFCPYASRFPYETWIVPKTHAAHFEETPSESLTELAGVLRSVISQVESLQDPPAYNYFLHTAPWSMHELKPYRWRIQITPRLTRIAGCELATGVFINPVAPERAAANLRVHERNLE